MRRRIAAGVGAGVVVGLAAVGAGASPSGAAPTCSATLGIAVHGQHIVGDYVTGEHLSSWPPAGQVGAATGGSGAAVPGGPGPGFHLANGFAPGASFCLDQSRSPGSHPGAG